MKKLRLRGINTSPKTFIIDKSGFEMQWFFARMLDKERSWWTQKDHFLTLQFQTSYLPSITSTSSSVK